MLNLEDHFTQLYDENEETSWKASLEVVKKAGGDFNKAVEMVISHQEKSVLEENKADMSKLLKAMSKNHIETAADILKDLFMQAELDGIDNMIKSFLNGKSEPEKKDFTNLAIELLAVK